MVDVDRHASRRSPLAANDHAAPDDPTPTPSSMADPAPPVRITLARLDPRLVDPVPAAGPHPTAEVVDLGPAGERVYRP